MQPSDAAPAVSGPAGGAPPASDRAGRWVRPSEAARLLGVSERTVRRRVASGQYPAERAGRNARILLPAELVGEAAGEGAAARQDPTVRALVTVLDALKDALAAERARTQRLEERLEHLEDERTRLLLRLGREAAHSPADGAGAAPLPEPRPVDDPVRPAIDAPPA